LDGLEVRDRLSGVNLRTEWKGNLMAKNILLTGLLVLSELASIGTQLGAGAYAQTRTVPLAGDFQLAVAFSPQGTAAASAGSGGRIKVWDPRTGKQIHVILSPDSRIQRTLAFSPDGKILAAGGDAGKVRLYDLDSGKETQAFGDHVGFVKAMTFSPDGKHLATSAVRFAHGAVEKAEIRVWDVGTGVLIRTWNLGNHEYSQSLSISPDGVLLASAEGSLQPIGPVRIRDLLTGAVVRSFNLDTGYVSLVAFSPDGKELAGGGPVERDVSELRIWDLESGKARLRLRKVGPNLESFSYSPDGHVLATACNGLKRQGAAAAEVRFWNLQNGELLRTSAAGEKSIPSLAFAPDGKTLILCDATGVVLIDASTGLLKSRLLTVPR
jgi:WD40 repeat protein